MSYKEFISIILTELKTKLPKGITFKLQKVTKNNGLVLDGLVIFKEGGNVSPTFYLNYYFDDYKEHHDINKIIDLILSTYTEQAVPDSINIDFYTDFQNVKPNIVYKIINFEMNKELLKEIPHIPYLDLAIVFYCVVKHEYFPNASILIRNDHLRLWQIDDQDLYQIAIVNTPALLPHEIININDIIHENFTDELPVPSSLSCMYVLSNQSKNFGAATILYLNLLKEISEKFNSSFYLLPSSIHEVILVPSETAYDIKHYSAMVQQVNESHVQNEDILSNHAYFYDRNEHALTY